MLIRTAAAALVVSGLIAGPAFSQTAPNPTQQSVVTDAQGRPVFRVTIVGRTIPAVNYRPRRGDTELDMVGTALMPRARGEIEVSGKKGYMEITGKFDRIDAPTRFGSEYLTYVMWAITPEGRATNLGELQITDERRVRVTTELQAFGLIITAEPYFAVTQPSDVVIMENAVKRGADGIEITDAEYELLKRGSYVMNQDYAQLKLKAPEPGARLDLAEARNAVALARVAGAPEYAADVYGKAERLLIEAEQARERRQSGNSVQQPARQAVQTAEDARIIALQRQEEAFQARERALAAQREADALARARAEEARRQLAESERAQAEASRLAAERQRLDAETAKATAERQRLDAEAAKAMAERQRLDAEAAKAAADSAQAEAERARLDADRERVAAEAARAAAESQAQQAREAAAQAERDKADLRDQLRIQLNAVLDTRETARGLIVNLSDVLFDFNKADLKPGAREKLAKVSGLVLAHPGLKMDVEGHADSIGTDNYNQRLSERRAESVRLFLVQQGISGEGVSAGGFGESQPVATNGTPEGRQQNRRVELVVSGEPIGTLGQRSELRDFAGNVR